MERAWKPNVEVAPHCPRCASSNTKFCYYNNYSLTQPRYFCKGCRRYWTKGGSLRNVPVGGGCRKNRRNSKIFRSSSSNGFRGLAYSGIAVHAPLVQHMGSSITGNSAIEPTNSISTMTSDGSNIDLALVFANFVNQKPEESDRVRDNEKPELYSESCDINLPSGAYEGLNFTSPEDMGAYQETFLSGMSSFHKHQHGIGQYSSGYDGMVHLELPTLPGEEEEEASVQEFMWSSSDLMLNHGAPPAQTPLMLDQEVEDADLLVGNWSPFDLSRDDPFPKPL